MTTLRDDYDTPWKEAVERYFSEFMDFYFPKAHAKIDWTKPYRFLNQELAQVVQDAELGKRLADRLVEVAIVGGGEAWVYIHIEVQGQFEKNFAERLFIYNYRIYDRFRCPVATLAVLVDDDKNWRPDQFGYELFESRLYLEFPSVKLSDHQNRLDELLTEPNPFAIITAAHLFTRQTKANVQQRYALKWQLARLLYERDWDKQRIIDLYSFIDWLMKLPEELNHQLWCDIETLERNKNMPYVTWVERFGIEKGLKQGLQLGLEQGLEQGLERGLEQGLERGLERGLEQGLEKGMQQGEANVVIRLLTRRFGSLPQATQDHLKQATTEQLELWTDRVLEAKTLESIFDSH